MRISRAVVLAASLGAAVLVASPAGHAKGKAKGGGGGGGGAPTASAAEVDKLKAVRLGDPKAGTFKWGMKPEEVMAQVKTSLEAKYEARIAQAKADPGKQQRIRDELTRETNAVKKSFTKFEGGKSGWDVSIVGPEFQQGTAEAVLVTKEDVWTRYFFFFEDGLYKMFLAFNKDAIAGKSFTDFGKMMEAKYGHAKEVFRDDKVRGGVKRSLDHYEWSAAGGDRLKLIDRSEFYGVYCLVLVDGGTNDRVVDRRKAVNPGNVEKDALVESVTQKESGGGGGDINDDIIDRVTGHQVKKPGEDDGKHGNIVVPSPSGGGAKTASAKENKKAAASAPEKDSGGDKKKSGGKKNDATDGLEL
jgi:hypothetical protein